MQAVLVWSMVQHLTVLSHITRVEDMKQGYIKHSVPVFAMISTQILV